MENVLWARSRRFISALLLLLVPLLIASACSRNGAQVYRIGVVAPLTGEGAAYGNAMKQGIDMAISDLNARGGVNGHQLAAVYEDDRLSAKDGVAAFSRLTSTYRVPVVIGSAASRVTLGIAPLAQKQRVVLFSSISTADELRDAGDYIFRNVPANSLQGKTAAAFVTDFLKAHNVAILFKNDDYGSNLASTFRAHVQAKAVNIIFDDSYDPSARDFRNVLSRLGAANPEAVFIPGNYQDNALILRQAREIGISVPFVGGDGAFSDELIKLAGPAAENSYYTMMGVPNTLEVKQFKERYHSLHNLDKEPNVFVYYAYDAMQAIAKAIAIGGYTSDGIKRALHELEYEGLTGVIKFDEFGGVEKPYSIYKVNSGRFELMDWQPSQ